MNTKYGKAPPFGDKNYDSSLPPPQTPPPPPPPPPTPALPCSLLWFLMHCHYHRHLHCNMETMEIFMHARMLLLFFLPKRIYMGTQRLILYVCNVRLTSLKGVSDIYPTARCIEASFKLGKNFPSSEIRTWDHVVYEVGIAYRSLHTFKLKFTQSS